MDTLNDQTADQDTSAMGLSRLNAWVAYLLLFAMLFTVSALATFGWQNRHYISQLFYQSSLQKHKVMTGEAGPATYYVFHNDFEALEEITRSNDDILGIETSEFSGVAAMAFTSIDAEAVEAIRTHPAVVNMIQDNIPMICH